MVAGRRLRGQDEKRSAQHQTGSGGELRVEAGVEDGRCPGEARRLGARVEAGGHVDEERNPDRQRSEGEDDAAKALTARLPRRDDGEYSGE
jgi:hypothetical protein